MKKIIIIAMLSSSFLMQAVPVLTTFINKTGIVLQVQCTYSDHSIETKNMSPMQSYPVVNFDTKILQSAIFSSDVKDKRGNLYTQLDKQFTHPTQPETYELQLQSVPAHKIPASKGTDAFMMPETYKIICIKVSNLDK